ncbi:unnamed protein product [Tetraodon nigroviridis]|uniref:(spotted green pufferfish) hypothetical protein n=1 Tax=Tetraodon nigroviridis TaxID=99883 RepID=Q4RP60_TETNG|nr:unnamed protein product [Tetraodon nigroviridis]
MAVPQHQTFRKDEGLQTSRDCSLSLDARLGPSELPRSSHKRDLPELTNCSTLGKHCNLCSLDKCKAQGGYCHGRIHLDQGHERIFALPLWLLALFDMQQAQKLHPQEQGPIEVQIGQKDRPC